jgi:hypothetical protein
VVVDVDLVGVVDEPGSLDHDYGHVDDYVHVPFDRPLRLRASALKTDRPSESSQPARDESSP